MISEVIEWKQPKETCYPVYSIPLDIYTNTQWHHINFKKSIWSKNINKTELLNSIANNYISYLFMQSNLNPDQLLRLLGPGTSLT